MTEKTDCSTAAAVRPPAPRHRWWGGALALTVALVGLSLGAAAGGASGGAPWVPSPAPTGAGSMAPRLATDGERLYLTWVAYGSPSRPKQVRIAWLEGDTWSAPVTIHGGDDVLANWADTPRLLATRSGPLVAAWPATLDHDDAYGLRVATSGDRGVGWSEPAWLHTDLGPSEHGFAALVAGQAAWLDGREMPGGGAMALRWRRLLPAPGPGERVLDDRVCECCSISAALTHGGPVVAYRDRSEGEVRDIYVVRQTFEGWQPPVRVAEDGWRLQGCPVQGPAAAALADRSGGESSDVLLVAWFTAAGDRPQVKVAFSADGGAHFDPPLVVDGSQPAGRVDAVLADERAGWVAWLDRDGDDGVLAVARVERGGGSPDVETVAPMPLARTSGFPSLARVGDRLWIAWTTDAAAGGREVRVARRDER